MKKPLIGINPYYFNYRNSFWNGTRDKYYTAIWKAGGVPVTVHHSLEKRSVFDLVKKIDGFVMVGGPDIPCNLYKGNNAELLDKDVMLPERESFDRQLFLTAKQFKKPVLGICVGLQHINVIYGGSLYEDLKTLNPSKIDHGEFNGKVSYHDVFLNKKSYLFSVLKKTNIKVASTHHQGIHRLGEGLSVSGTAPDGLVESIEDLTSPELFLAVQWHPEIMTDDETQLKLFQWLCFNSLKRSHL